MHPELTFNLFGAAIEVKSYALFTVLGALAGTLSALPLMRREGLKARQSLVLLACMAAAFFVGARLFNYAVNPAAYGKSLHFYSLRLAGLSVYGGIIGALSALLLWGRRTKTNVWRLLDALVLPSALAFSLARVGCYLNGCCAGIPTDSFFGVVFPSKGDGQVVLSGFLSILVKSADAAHVYPTQLFEIGLALLGLFPALWLYFKKKNPHGAAFLLYGVWFSAMRLAILPLRSLPYPDIVTKVVYPVFYLLLIVVGLALLVFQYKRRAWTSTQI